MQHFDDARGRAAEILGALLRDKPAGWRTLLVTDVLARMRVILWTPESNKWESIRDETDRKLRAECGPYWSGRVLQGRTGKHPDSAWQEDAWGRATPVDGSPVLRTLERHRSKVGWFDSPERPPWKTRRNAAVITLFYSFKGGVGRSTALAATALHLAAEGERVVVVDTDLDAPGVGSLLDGQDGAIASWGVVDYLIEQPILCNASDTGSGPELSDYYHRFASVSPTSTQSSPPPPSDYYHRLPSITSGSGEILVFPTGLSKETYIEKLSRIEYGERPGGSQHPFVSLFEQIRSELVPDWILIDSRAGLSDVSGFFTGGLCHIHVLFGTMAEASWRGVELILDRIGGRRLRGGRPQAECVLAAAMLPRTDQELYEKQAMRFTDRSLEAFSANYYAEAEPETSDRYWTLDDSESSDAPHVPVVLPYDERLAVFRNLREVADTVLLGEKQYGDLVKRLRSGRDRL